MWVCQEESLEKKDPCFLGIGRWVFPRTIEDYGAGFSTGAAETETIESRAVCRS